LLISSSAWATEDLLDAGFQNLVGLSFSGNGEALSGTQLLEAAERSAQSLRGSASAGERGDAAYSVPISAPAALLAPRVSLDYSSAAGEHTWVARGWSIGHGQVTVQKMRGREAAQVYGTLDSPHRVSGGGFDGVLYKNPGGAWEYRSQGTLDVEFEYFPASESWLLQKGAVRTWLEPRADVLALGVEPLEWFPAQVQDRSGNTMHLEWDNGQLQSIEYGGWCGVATGQPCQVDTAHLVRIGFQYDAAPRATTRFIMGYEDVRDELLASIEVQTGAPWSTVNTTVLQTDAQAPTGPMLEAVELHGTSVGGSPVVRTLMEMDYTVTGLNQNPPLMSALPEWLDRSQSTELGPNQYGSRRVSTHTLADYSGDGMPDLVNQSSGQALWNLIDRSALGDPRDPNDPVFEVEPADHYFESGVGVALTEWIEPAVESGPCSGSKSARYGTTVIQDVDGDGHLDAVIASVEPEFLVFDSLGSPQDHCTTNIGGPTTWEVRYGGNNGFLSASTTGSSAVAAPFNFPSMGSVLALVPFPSETPPPVSAVSLGQETLDGAAELYDMNGDGWSDVVAPDGYGRLQVYLKLPGRDTGWASTPVLWGDDPAFVALTRTVAWTTGPVLIPEEAPPYKYTSARAKSTYTMSGLRDLNGDGLVDFVQACADPVGGVNDYWWCGSDEAAAEDGASGEGMSGPAAWTVWFNNGSGFEPPRPWALPVGEGVRWTSSPVTGTSSSSRTGKAMARSTARRRTGSYRSRSG